MAKLTLVEDTLTEQVARAMRLRYAEMTGDRLLIDFKRSRARREWLACAEVAIAIVEKHNAGK